MAKSVNDYLSEIEEKTGFSSGNIQSAEEWLAEKDKREFADKIQKIQNKLDEISNSVDKLQSSVDDYAAKVTEPTEATEEIQVEAPSGSTVFPFQQAAVFTLAGMLVGILLSFLVFRKMVEKVKKNYESRLSEARDSLERMIKIMSEKQ